MGVIRAYGAVEFVWEFGSSSVLELLLVCAVGSEAGLAVREVGHPVLVVAGRVAAFDYVALQDAETVARIARRADGIHPGIAGFRLRRGLGGARRRLFGRLGSRLRDRLGYGGKLLDRLRDGLWFGLSAPAAGDHQRDDRERRQERFHGDVGAGCLHVVDFSRKANSVRKMSEVFSLCARGSVRAGSCLRRLSLLCCCISPRGKL